MLIVLQRGADTWTSYSVIRMKVTGQEIEKIVDYIYCPWIIPAATSISLVGSREMRDQNQMPSAPIGRPND